MRDLIFGEPGSAGGKSPEAAAQENMRPALPKRFYKQVTIEETGDGFGLRLDGRAMKTPAKTKFALPTEAAAKLAAAEWDAQGERIDPSTMPVTRIANTALDGVAKEMAAVAEDITRFAANDLLCYRAGYPEALKDLQERHWNPILDWAAIRLKARFQTGEGILHVDQPAQALRAYSDALSAFLTPIEIACLHTMTTLTGSALLALALAEDEIDLEAAWTAAHVDEDFNIAQWGEDFEAAQRRTFRFGEMTAAEKLLRAVR